MKGRNGIWGVREWMAVIVLSLGAIGLTACGEPVPTQTTIVNINTNTNTVNVGESGAKNPAAVDGSVTSDTASVTINGMANGENCPSGVKKADKNGQIRLGCTLDITVNPRNGAGEVIHDTKAPPPDYFISLGPDSVASFVKDANPYNGRLTALAVGSVKLIASVHGKRTEPEAVFEVIP